MLIFPLDIHTTTTITKINNNIQLKNYYYYSGKKSLKDFTRSSSIAKKTWGSPALSSLLAVLKSKNGIVTVHVLSEASWGATAHVGVAYAPLIYFSITLI